MRLNPERRAALADAAIDVLARAGARGLTYRAVDAQAGVPPGTASNYFRTRDDLLAQAGRRVHERMRPDDAQLAVAAAHPPSRARLIELLQDLVRRVLAQRTVYLALMELRLEATRRPPLRAALAETVRASFEADLAFHRAARLPGDRQEAMLLYLAIGGLVFEQLTLPDVLTIEDLDAFVALLADRLVPPTSSRRPPPSDAPAE